MYATLRPNGIGYSDALFLGAGANKYVACDPGDPISHDDVTTYVYWGSGETNLIQSFTATDPPGWIVGLATTTVNVEARWQSNNAGTWLVNGGARLSGTNSHATAWSRSATGWFTELQAVTRPGGGNWTFSDLPGVEVLFRPNDCTGMGIQNKVTSVWLSYDGTPAPTGWLSVMAEILGPVIGAGLLLGEIPKLIRAFNRAARGRYIIHGHEALDLYRGLRDHPHRRYCFLGA